MCESNHVQTCTLSPQILETQPINPTVKIHQKDCAINDNCELITTNFRLPYLSENKNVNNHYKSSPKSTIANAKMTTNRISSHLASSVLGSAVKNIHKQYYGFSNSNEHFKNKGIQTDYRESECQTLPWESPYKIISDKDPEVLTLEHLTWGHGLPAGMHEIEIINRMRMKRAWEQILPPMDTSVNIKMRSAVITALEADKWAFRDAEIQFILNLRMNLAEKLMLHKEDVKRKKMEERFNKFNETLDYRKSQKIKFIKNKFLRELRKLTMKHKNTKMQYSQHNVRYYCDHDSVLGDPKSPCNYLKITENLRCERLVSRKMFHSNIDKTPNWLFSSKKMHYNVPKPSIQICKRKVKKDEKKLFEIGQKLDSLKANSQLLENCKLLKHKQKIPSLPSTPRRSPAESADDEIDQSTNLLQKLVKGRALQNKILESKAKYKELIEELQSVKLLNDADEASELELSHSEKETENKAAREKKVNEILNALEGKTVANMLTILNSELARLENEKLAHALALLEKKEKIKKDIEQTKKEELEIKHRRQIDEIFREILKINQESVETYLEDILHEGIEWVSKKESERYIRAQADEADIAADRIEDDIEKVDKEGIVSQMIYNLVLPEVTKESARRLHQKQKSYLRSAHASIYDEILNIPAGVLLADESVSDNLDSSVEQYLTNISYESKNKEFEMNDEIYNDDNFEFIIEKILYYSGMLEDKYKPIIWDILEQLLQDAEYRIKN